MSRLQSRMTSTILLTCSYTLITQGVLFLNVHCSSSTGACARIRMSSHFSELLLELIYSGKLLGSDSNQLFETNEDWRSKDDKCTLDVHQLANIFIVLRFLWFKSMANSDTPSIIYTPSVEADLDESEILEIELDDETAYGYY